MAADMLKDAFPGFHSLDERELRDAWQKGSVILDINVLLGLYRYDAATQSDLLNALRRVSTRLWMPYHVGLEYSRKRLSVIAGEKRAFAKASAAVGDYVGKIGQVFSDSSRNPHPSTLLKSQLAELNELVTRIISEVDNLGGALPDVNERDLIRESLSELYKDRIGAPPSQEWVESAQATAIKRFENKIPPGFEDERKTEIFTDRGITYNAQHGDVFIWLQILAEAKSSKWPALIFVTDDVKEDWWLSESGKKLGPRAELREEIARVSNVLIFQSYTTAQFLEHANRQVDANVSEASIALVREIASPRPQEKSTFNNMQRYAQGAVRRWLKSTVSPGTEVIPVAFPIDFLLKQDKDRHGVIVRYVAGPPNAEVGPYVLGSLGSSFANETFDMGLEYIDCYLVFQSRSLLQSHVDDVLIISRDIMSAGINLRPKVGTLMRTVDGNFAYVPFEMGIFE
jgi:hypothetical protein